MTSSTPAEHSRISKLEHDYIIDSLKGQVAGTNTKTTVLLSVNPLKGSGVRWLHFELFSAIQV